jgi:rubrerythrin
MKPIEGLVIAIKKELEAMSMYTQLANLSTDASQKKLFQELASMERGHKARLEDIYTNMGLDFVLLVGDATQVATPTASGGASDPSYSKLSGSDDLPDVIVGRFSAETAEQVDTQVRRTIDYESAPALLRLGTTLEGFYSMRGRSKRPWIIMQRH